MHRRPSIIPRLRINLRFSMPTTTGYFEGGDAFFVGLAVIVIAAFGIMPMLLLY
jgi:hypothetical protein